ncbi:MAG TPA: helix-turn-helix domain-containing protein [Polyangiaceae bacterium]|nr:helix-turn-helix domain-containing protein [Polyangiaceae bacterium]
MSTNVTERRNYRQFCGVARALDRVGERWTLLLVRNLLLGPKRYGELLESLPDITTNLLAKRLREMTELGLIEKKQDHYALTESGAALEPVIMELGRWGGRFLTTPERDDRLDIGWGLLSMKRRYAGGLKLVAELRVDDRTFELSFSPTYLSVQERPATLPEVTLQGSTAAFRALFWLGVPFERLRAEGELVASGEIETLLGAFTPPPSAAPAAGAPAKSSAVEPPRRKSRAGRASRRGA